jgi:hypothetical protein
MTLAGITVALVAAVAADADTRQLQKLAPRLGED